LISSHSLHRFFILTVGIPFFQINAQVISWSPYGGPYSGPVQQLVVDKTGNIFAATATGMCRSTDAGGSWTTLGLYLEFGPSYLTADSSGNIYTGNSSQGLFESTDHGASWAKVNLTGNVYCATALSGNRICVGQIQHVSMSSDGGRSWSPFNVTSDNVPILSIAEDRSGILYAGLERYTPRPPAIPSGGGIFVSSDSGNTWTYDGAPLGPVTSILIDNRGKLYTIEGPSTYMHGLIYSLEPHDSVWHGDSSGIPYWVSFVEALVPGTSGEATLTTDMGIFAYNSSSNTWKSSAPAVSMASITSAVYGQEGTIYAGTGQDGIFFWRNSSQEWIQCGIQLAQITAISFDSFNNLFVGTTDGVFEQHSSDKQWRRVSNGLASTKVYQLEYSAVEGRLYGATGNGLSYLPDSSMYWIPLSKLPTFSFAAASFGKYSGTSGGIINAVGEQDIWNRMQTVGLPITDVHAILIDSSKDLVVGTLYDGLFRSSDGGFFWEPEGVNTSLIFCTVNALAIDSQGRMFAGTDTGGAFYSDDSGISWFSIPSIGGKNVTCFLVSRKSLYLAGTAGNGLFASTDRGLNWFRANEGLDDSTITAMEGDAGGNLYVGTENGLFKGNGIALAVNNKLSNPYSYKLLQNFPNPFNPATVISYHLPENTFVTLEVFDMLGREVKVLVRERESAGDHSVTFDASNLSSGTYICRMTAGGYVKAEKMILVK
jgi:ligand-binding sensor domain-containing protein